MRKHLARLAHGPYWRREMLRLWSRREALFWGSLIGLYACWDTFQDYLPVLPYAAVSVLIRASIAAACVMKRPGANDT